MYFKSGRQDLTPVDNLLHLLKQPIFEKIKLVAFYSQRKVIPTNESVYGIDSLLAVANASCC